MKLLTSTERCRLEQQPSTLDDYYLNLRTAQKLATAQSQKLKLSGRPQTAPNKPETRSYRKPNNGVARKPKPETA